MHKKTLYYILTFNLIILLLNTNVIYCMEISDTPLETIVFTPPGILFFLIDDSSSMNKSILTDDKYGDYFIKETGQWFGYILDNKDNIYGKEHSILSSYPESWKLRFWQFNKLYYNPNVNYEPWPDINKIFKDNNSENADLDMPRSSPVNDFRVNINNTFSQLLNHEIPISHYFTYQDTNKNGIFDEGENVFMVEMVKTESSGNINYYFFDNKNNFEELEQGELIKLSEDSLPEIFRNNDNTPKTYDQEKQNFANWFSYYRRREYCAKAAIALAIKNLSNLKIGISTINNKIIQKPVPVNTTDISGNFFDESANILYKLYNISSNGQSSLKMALNYIGEYFDMNLQTVESHLYDYESSACQKHFIIIVTDGYYSGEGQITGNSDGDNNTIFDGTPYGDLFSNTIADIAMKYYETDLAPMIPNLLPVSQNNEAQHQHIITSAISFGLKGNLETNQIINCPPSCPIWQKPDYTDLSTIDDLIHATINGRGMYFQAQNPKELIDGLKKITQNISNESIYTYEATTNGAFVRHSTFLFQTSFNTSNWTGDLLAYKIDNNDSYSLNEPAWSASQTLNKMDWKSERKIISFNNSKGIPFNNEYFDELMLSKELINYIRGDLSNEKINGMIVRKRDSILGDIIHSSPLFYNNIIYIGANDGMLHAFNAQNGKELFSYIPGELLSNLEYLTNKNYNHKYYVDGLIYITKIDDIQFLIGGLGKGGRSYYCLDISNISVSKEIYENELAKENLKWEYQGINDQYMGYSYSKAYIVKSNYNLKKVAIFGNGYNSPSQISVLYILDALTGKKFINLNGKLVPGIFTDVNIKNNGLSSPALIDIDNNQTVDYVYAGDLQGNIWKFDLRNSNPEDWKVAYNEYSDYTGKPKPIFRAIKENNISQPVTTRPEVIKHCLKNRYGYIIIFSTGKYLENQDLIDKSVQSIYGVWDWSDQFDDISTIDINEGAVKYLGNFNKNSLKIISSENINYNIGLLKQNLSFSPDKQKIISNNKIYWYPEKKGSLSHVGWYIDFNIDKGEKVINDPIVIGNGNLIITSFTPHMSYCKSGGYSYIYSISACDGHDISKHIFETNEDEKENIPIGVKIDGIVKLSTIIPESGKMNLLFQSSLSEIISISINPLNDISNQLIKGKFLYWKEIF